MKPIAVPNAESESKMARAPAQRAGSISGIERQGEAGGAARRRHEGAETERPPHAAELDLLDEAIAPGHQGAAFFGRLGGVLR
jgi:hypothetical protein